MPSPDSPQIEQTNLSDPQMPPPVRIRLSYLQTLLTRAGLSYPPMPPLVGIDLSLFQTLRRVEFKGFQLFQPSSDSPQVEQMDLGDSPQVEQMSLSESLQIEQFLEEIDQFPEEIDQFPEKIMKLSYLQMCPLIGVYFSDFSDFSDSISGRRLKLNFDLDSSDDDDCYDDVIPLFIWDCHCSYRCDCHCGSCKDIEIESARSAIVPCHTGPMPKLPEHENVLEIEALRVVHLSLSIRNILKILYYER